MHAFSHSYNWLFILLCIQQLVIKHLYTQQQQQNNIDCEYREPGGGYRMADQSSARPKWIPCYDKREFEVQNKEHTTKWSTDIFTDGPAVTKVQFVERLINMDFAPPLGGPYMAASAASIEDDSAAAALFDILAGEKEKLTRHRMGKEMKVLSNGEEGVTWAMFSDAMGAK